MANYKVIAKQAYGNGSGVDDCFYDDILIYDTDRECFRTGSGHKYDSCKEYADCADGFLSGIDYSYQDMSKDELVSLLYDYCILDDDDMEYVEDMSLDEILEEYEPYLIDRMESDFVNSDIYDILGFVCEGLEKEFGGIWDYDTIRGSVQGEYAYIVYNKDNHNERSIEYFENDYFNNGYDYDCYVDGNYYVTVWVNYLDEDNTLEIIASAVGCDEDEIYIESMY